MEVVSTLGFCMCLFSDNALRSLQRTVRSVIRYVVVVRSVADGCNCMLRHAVVLLCGKSKYRSSYFFGKF
jgi:hypothetical protein